MSQIKSTVLKLAAIALLAAAVSGCGVEEMQKEQVQGDLTEAARQASIGQPKTAREWVDRAIAADPGDVDTYVRMSDGQEGTTIDTVFEALNDYATEAYYNRQAAARFPNDYQPLAALMNAQEMLGDTAGEQQTAGKLIPLLKARIAKGNADSRTRTTLADAYLVSGNRKLALATYQAAMSIYVADPEVYNIMAYSIAQVNSTPDLPQALNAAKTALAKAEQQKLNDDEIAEIQDTLGWVEYRMGNYKQAEADMDDALTALPREPESLYHLGMIYLGEGNKAAARAEFEKALAVAPDYANPKAGLALIDSGHGATPQTAATR